MPAESSNTATARCAAHLAAFTLAEVLAALMLMAIVVGVGMEAMSVASRAGILGHRKAEAAQVAESALAEYVATAGAQSSGNSSGTTTLDGIDYPWTVKQESWSVDSLTLVTAEVSFSVQGNAYQVSLSTLVDTSTSSD